MDYFLSICSNENSCMARCWITMDYRAGSTIPVFKRHVTVAQVRKYSCPCNTPWRNKALWNVENPTFARQSAYTPQTPVALYPRKLLILISIRSWIDFRAIVASVCACVRARLLYCIFYYTDPLMEYISYLITFLLLCCWLPVILGEGNSVTYSPDAGSSDMKHRTVDGRDGS
jgi:hypothetical protein